MSAQSPEVPVVAPDDAPRSEPVVGLEVHTPFAVDGHRLERLRVTAPSGWARRDGPLYGWVRDGHGRLETAGGESALDAGDFLRVPGRTRHRFVPAGAREGRERVEPLELLVVVRGEEAEAVGPPTGTEAPPDVVGPEALSPSVTSSDLVRETPFPDVADGVLLLRVRAAGGAKAGFHHHGGNVYFGYAVDGPSETEYGPDGERVARIEVGECFHVPPGLVHRDTNPTSETHTGVVWLCGGEPWVVNIDRGSG
jgi:mannose-6-phosphate isomerase-like protein (cupin superfamily)